MERLNDRVVLFLPSRTLEPEALAQIANVASLPIVFRHVAVMPDCHVGKGATIGTVIATKDAVIPAAVGVDIGCGMLAVRTDPAAGGARRPAGGAAGDRAPDSDECRSFQLPPVADRRAADRGVEATRRGARPQSLVRHEVVGA